MTKETVPDPDNFVPHRIVRVGQASTDDTQSIVQPDTTADPVGRAAIAKANEDVRDVPKRERIIKVGQAGEHVRSHATKTGGGGKIPSMVPAKIGDVYPGEHRYAHQLEKGDRILNLGDPTPEIGRWIRVDQVVLVKVDGKLVDVTIHGHSEAGFSLQMNLQANAQTRLVTNQEAPYG